MLSIYKFCLAAHFLSNIITLSIQGRIDGIMGPSSAVGHEGHEITLMWNTTNGISMKSAIFGISNGGMADPQFVNVNTLSGKVHYNPKISKTYIGRVDFVGNLTAGQGWFIIRNLKLNDSNEYLARITIDVDTVRSYTVRLQVIQLNEFQTKKAKHLASTVPSIMKTNGWRPSNKTIGNGPHKNTVTAIQLKLFFLIISVLVVVFLIIIVTYYKIKRNKSSHLKQRQRNSKEICDIQPAKESFINNNEEKDLKLLPPI